MLTVVALLAVNLANEYVPAISDWYTRMALSYLPDSALRFAPIDDEEEAFYVCARSVARRVGGESSIATFASTDVATTAALENGRLVIQSHVEESLEAGARQRHAFTCTVRAERDRWVVEKLEIEEIETPPADMAGPAASRRLAAIAR